MLRTWRDFGFAVNSTGGCDFDFSFGAWRDLGFAVDLTGVRDFDFDFGFSSSSSSSVSMNSLLTIQVFFGPAMMVSTFLFFPVGFSVVADLLLGPASGLGDQLVGPALGFNQTDGGLWGVSIRSIEDGFTETGREELAGTGSDAGGLHNKVGGIRGEGPL